LIRCCSAAAFSSLNRCRRRVAIQACRAMATLAKPCFHAPPWRATMRLPRGRVVSGGKVEKKPCLSSTSSSLLLSSLLLSLMLSVRCCCRSRRWRRWWWWRRLEEELVRSVVVVLMAVLS
jgi:hypothetical protein